MPYAECSDFISDWRAKSPGCRLIYYVSGTDMPAYRSATSKMFNGGKKSTWIRDRMIQFGELEEKTYLHFYNDTKIKDWNGTSYDTALIPGTNSMIITAKDSVSRVPNGYTHYLFSSKNTYSGNTRLAPNFTNPKLRKAYKEYLTKIFNSTGGAENWPSRTGYWDGVFFDNYNHTNLQGGSLVSGGLVVETGTAPANLLTYGTDAYGAWGWQWMLVFGREVRDTLRTSDQWSADHKKKVLAYNFGNYHKSILENPDSSGADVIHYEFAWDPIACSNQSIHKLENLYTRDSLSASRGVTHFWSSVPRTSYNNSGTTTVRQAIYNNLCFYYVAKSDSTWIFMRPAPGNAYGAFVNPNLDTLAWIPAMEHELGLPLAHYQFVMSGASPDQSGATYKVFARDYQQGRVYTRPRDGLDAKWGDASMAVTVNLGGSYRQVLTDNTVGPVVTTISLRGGEGAIMLPATVGDCSAEPKVPLLLTPINGDTVVGSFNTLVVSNVSAPHGGDLLYSFRVFSDSLLTKQVEISPPVAQTVPYTTFTTTATYDNNQPYYWQVRVYDGQSWCSWSPVQKFWHFDMLLDVEDEPSLLSPPDGSVEMNAKPVFRIAWSGSRDTMLCFFEIALDSAFANPVDAGSVIGHSRSAEWSPNSALENELTYYWRARLENIGFGQVASFVISAQVFVSPNPFSYLVGELTIHNLPPGSKFEVYTPAGELVARLEDLNGNFNWNVRNVAGEKLAPGVYLYYVRVGDRTIADKFIVVR